MSTPSISLRPQQEKAFDMFKTFCESPTEKVFILKGYAGTGKTTLLKFFIDYLIERHYLNSLDYDTSMSSVQSVKGKFFVPMASTGRAAKILSNKIGQPATTVHSKIYDFKDFNQDLEKMTQDIEKKAGVDDTGALYLSFDFMPIKDNVNQYLYIVDEASMIGDKEDTQPVQAKFGSGRLLSDLLHYDPKGKFVFVGDDCQLPPVNDVQSPALSEEYIKSVFCLPVMRITLTDIVRQKEDNDIISCAARLRSFCLNPPHVDWAKFPMRHYQHIHILHNEAEVIKDYVDNMKANGYNGATLITAYNKDCNTISSLVRKQLGFTNPLLMVGELLLVTQNNPCGLMNGDLVTIESIGNRIRLANLTFVDVEVKELVTGRLYRTLLVEDILYSGKTNLNHIQQKKLFIDFYYREKRLNHKQRTKEFNDDLRKDVYLNALRAVFGYALTCHKAQGGEWPKVYVDIPRRFTKTPTKSTYQWVYTAVTRTSDTLYTPDDFFIN